MENPAPDIRKSLGVLNNEWESCTKCSLGENRAAVGGNFVSGEGHSGGIMFIGEGPGREEEASGRPFIGQSGKLLRHAISRLGIAQYYITNIVTCRSCAQAYNSEGQPRYSKDYKTGDLVPTINDQSPTPVQIAACLPRIHEEIYLVDPVLIVALGGIVAEALAHRKVHIQTENGTPCSIKIPGAGYRPVLTEKRQVWVRKVKGALIMPRERNEVEYLMVPILHPAFVARKGRDERWQNPVQMFTQGMLRAVNTYDRYMLEVFGDTHVTRNLDERDIQQAMTDE